MLDPTASRQTAHIFLDAAAVHHRDDTTSDNIRDDMTALALQQLRDVGLHPLGTRRSNGRITVDIVRAGAGILAVIIACLDGWAACSNVDRDEVIAQVRATIGTSLTDDYAH